MNIEIETDFDWEEVSNINTSPEVMSDPFRNQVQLDLMGKSLCKRMNRQLYGR